MSINHLKEDRQEKLERLRLAMDQAAYLDRERASNRHLLNRLGESLYTVNREDIFKRINACAVGRRCSSLWCKHCRGQSSLAAANKIFERVERKNYCNDSFLHVTAPVGLAQFDIEGVNEILKKDDLRWKRIRKKNDFWIEAIYEFELVHYRNLINSSGSNIKKIQMKQMVDACSMNDNEFIFVHWHGITDLKRDEIDHTFAQEYFVGASPLSKTTKSGLYVQKFHGDKTLDQNIKKLTSYPFKNAYRFKHSFKGSDYTNGEYFTTEELGRLVALYDDAQGRQMRRLRRHCGHPSD